jgi:hypothetical protein
MVVTFKDRNDVDYGLVLAAMHQTVQRWITLSRLNFRLIAMAGGETNMTSEDLARFTPKHLARVLDRLEYRCFIIYKPGHAQAKSPTHRLDKWALTESGEWMARTFYQIVRAGVITVED